MRGIPFRPHMRRAEGDSHGGRGRYAGRAAAVLIGLGLAAVGSYLLTQQVTVQTGSWTIGGYNAFGLSLIPFILGVGLLFFDGRSRAGFLLLFLGVLIIAAGILMKPFDLFPADHSLFNTLMMIGMTAAGCRVAPARAEELTLVRRGTFARAELMAPIIQT